MTATNPSNPVRVSVVAATYKRPERLSRLLDTLAAQEDAPPYEVIIVDDASPDETPEVLARRQQDYPVPLRSFRQETNTGPAACRNRGWRAASGPIVCFTDDDCRPDPRWLAEMVACFDSPSHPDIVQGKTLHDRTEKENVGPWCLTINIQEERGYYETCNMGYRREWLEKCGGFDETFREPFGEDADLAWRAKTIGATTAFADAAVVLHAVWPSDFKRYLRSLRRHRSIVLVLSRHPQLRDRLPRPWLFKTSHLWTMAVAVASLIALARPRRPWLWIPVLLSANRYRAAAAETRHPPKRKADIPVWVVQGLVADSYEIGVMAAASMRHRTLVL